MMSVICGSWGMIWMMTNNILFAFDFYALLAAPFSRSHVVVPTLLLQKGYVILAAGGDPVSKLYSLFFRILKCVGYMSLDEFFLVNG